MVDRLSAALREILDQAALRARLTEMASEPIWMDPAATDRFVGQEYTRWAPVVKAADVKPE